jgi:hypothetical protein
MNSEHYSYYKNRIKYFENTNALKLMIHVFKRITNLYTFVLENISKYFLFLLYEIEFSNRYNYMIDN